MNNGAKTHEQVRADNVNKIKAKAQELYTCASNLRDAIEHHSDTGKIKGVNIKEMFPHLKDADLASMSSGEIRKHRRQLDKILADVDALLAALGMAGGVKA